jgi:hypothetical protein
MKVLIIGLGLILGATGGFMAYVSVDRENQKAKDAQGVEAEILDLQKKISLLKELPQRSAVPLDAAYVALINDMHVIARAHRVACTMSVQGGNDTDIGKSVAPSVFSGLREVRLHGVFSGLTRRPTLLSLLDALAAFEKESPVLFQNIGHEKDALMFDIKIVGL